MLDLTPNDIANLQEAWNVDWNETISPELAREHANTLLELYFLVVRWSPDEIENP